MVSTSTHWQVSIPLVYTQLVEIVIHIYFLCTLFGMQVQITMRMFNDQSNDNENVHANDNENVNCSSQRVFQTFIISSIFSQHGSSGSPVEPSRRYCVIF